MIKSVLNKKVILNSVLFLGLISNSFAQISTPEPADEEEDDEPKIMLEKPKPVWKQNLRYGGNVWLGFFGSFYIDVSPMLGYDVTGKGTVLGVGVPFIYQGQYRQAASIAVGGRVFIRQAVWRSIFLHGEYEYMNANKESFFNKKPGESTRQWGGSPLIGAGFYQGRTRLQKGSFISVLFNTAAPNKGFISPQSLGGPDSPFVIRLGYFF